MRRNVQSAVAQLCFAVLLLSVHPAAAVPLGTAFTYQGQLQQGMAPSTATACDFQFGLFDALSGGSQIGATQTASGVPVSEGVFTVEVNSGAEFGAAAFDGNDRWLSIALRCPAGSGAFGAPLTPRQKVTAAPNAIFAKAAGDVNCTGCVSGTDLQNATVGSTQIGDNQVTSADIADLTVSGNDLANGAVSAAKIAPGTNGQVLTTTGGAVAWQAPAAAGWAVSGNNGTNPATNYVGTSDNTALTLSANGEAALRLIPRPSQLPNVVGGSIKNQVVGDTVIGATIAGGGGDATLQCQEVDGTRNPGHLIKAEHGTISGGKCNVVTAKMATVGGGVGNQAAGVQAMVGGGNFNTATGASAFIGAGQRNEASGIVTVIGGGDTNNASGARSTIAGGGYNIASGDLATVSGGGGTSASHGNKASGIGSTVGGGVSNLASGDLSTVGGGGQGEIGAGNAARATGATVAGGSENSTVGDWTSISGGRKNMISLSPFANWRGEASLVGGGVANTIVGATYSVIAGGESNQIADVAGVGGHTSNSAIGGGKDNKILTWYGTISGGSENSILEGASPGDWGVIGGGNSNTVEGQEGTVSGGSDNVAGPGRNATVAGGEDNIASGIGATVAGGRLNTASNSYATVLGGTNNIASGEGSLAAGRDAHAVHNGSFVWADGSGSDRSSADFYTFNIYADRGVRLGLNGGATALNSPGQLYRDNVIVAWGSIAGTGTVRSEFGVESVTRESAGRYQIVIDVQPIDTASIAVTVTAELDAPPTSAATARLAYANITATRDIFEVYITNGSYTAVDGDFMFLVTARGAE